MHHFVVIFESPYPLYFDYILSHLNWFEGLKFVQMVLMLTYFFISTIGPPFKTHY
jgi:hypothetical protein